MKKWLGHAGVVVCLLLLYWGVVWGAASSWSVSYSAPKPGEVPLIKSWSATWTGSGSDGNVTSYVQTASDIAFFRDYYVYGIEVDPGSPAPTDNWDITVVDANGLELATMSNFDNATTEFRHCVTTGGQLWYPPRDNTALTISVSGNSIVSATATIKFWLGK